VTVCTELRCGNSGAADLTQTESPCRTNNQVLTLSTEEEVRDEIKTHQGR
jgi:hypothetical protein